VARNKSISLSCEQLGISQPALTRSIKRLEGVLEFALFTRNRRGVELTPEGEIFYKYAEKIENQFNTALKEMSSVSQDSSKQVIIGADNLWAEAYLSEVLPQFYERYPDAFVRVVGGPVKAHLPSLIDGKTDIVLGSYNFSNVQTENIIKQKLANISYYVIARKGHPLHNLDKVEITDLTPYSWVIYQHASSFVWSINELFENNGLPKPKVTLHTSFLPQAIKHVQATDSLIFVPDRLIEYMVEHNLSRIEGLDSIHNMDSGYIVMEQTKKREEIDYLLSIISSSV
jgi:DNA-binding transcriptional LysR family regulator